MDHLFTMYLSGEYILLENVSFCATPILKQMTTFAENIHIINIEK